MPHTNATQFDETAPGVALAPGGGAPRGHSSIGGYARRVTVRAPRERVFDAITTLDGVRGWWTTLVTGSGVSGGELRFAFEGLDESIVMRVERATRPDSVAWTCIVHAGQDEWAGTSLTFELAERGAGTCELTFRHTGLAPELVEGGWEHFLASLAAYVEGGVGTPFGA